MTKKQKPTHLRLEPWEPRSLCGVKDPNPVVLERHAQSHIDGHGMVVCAACLERSPELKVGTMVVEEPAMFAVPKSAPAPACLAYGPWHQRTGQNMPRRRCNRMHGHESFDKRHRYYNKKTGEVIEEWDDAEA